jgi:lipoate---protein ligase
LEHGEYKTVGGKLVIADFTIADGHYADVAISGDFFLEPPEALEQINTAVSGQPVAISESELAEVIRSALSDDVEMVGFSPEAVAIAVKRGTG